MQLQNARILQELQSRHAIEVIEKQHEHRKDEEYVRQAVITKTRNNSLLIKPGFWSREVLPTGCTIPILFDIPTKQDHEGQVKLPFNPLEFLAEEFETYAAETDANLSVITSHEAFSFSQAHARHFYNTEFPAAPAVLVYATFSGNRLTFHALFGGIMPDQFVVDHETGFFQVAERQPKHLILGRFPFQAIADIVHADHDKKYVAYENLELLFDCVVNTTI